MSRLTINYALVLLPTIFLVGSSGAKCVYKTQCGQNVSLLIPFKKKKSKSLSLSTLQNRTPEEGMNPTIYLCVVLFGLCAATHGHHTPHHVDGHDEHNSTNLASQRISRSLAEFAIKFYRHICSTSPGKNIFFSPYSISSALSLLLLASKSTTHSQMLEGLGFNLTEIQENDIHNAFHHLFHKMTRSDSNVRLELGQALFLDDELKPLQKFLDDVQAFYDAEVLTAKFQEPKEAEKQINDYVEKKTHGKIVELVKGLDPVTALVLVNYIFFKGKLRLKGDS